MNRRQVIAAAGGGGLALVLGAGTWRVLQTPKHAFEPWSVEGARCEDIRHFAFAHAILAPNPHNRQPWLIRMEGRDRALLYCDLEKRLPETDPFDRQITIGFGTFIELARIAAAQCGIGLESEAFPDGDPGARLDSRPVARLTFKPTSQAQPDPLFGQIVKRRSNKTEYRTDQPPTVGEAAAVAENDASVIRQSDTLARLRDITTEAVSIEMRTARTHLESVRLMRIGSSEIDRNPDGIALAGPTIEAARFAGLVDRASLADPDSTPYQQGLEQQRAVCGSLPAAIAIVTAGNSRSDQLEAGRRYVRANLRATALGLAMHPVSQALQEYPEMAIQFGKLNALLGLRAPQRLQMLARLGRADPVGPAPRWPLTTHMIG
jgi:hypothetical protein